VPDLDTMWNSAIGKITSLVFRGVLLILLGLISWLGNQVYLKVDNALPKADFIEAQKDVMDNRRAIWSAVGSTTKSLTEVTNIQATLAAQIKAHQDMDIQQQAQIRDSLIDIRNRLNTLGGAASRP
jgi:hypothetical protein